MWAASFADVLEADPTCRWIIKALSLLLKIVTCYYLGMQLLAVTILAPYLTAEKKWRFAFDGPGGTSPTWSVRPVRGPFSALILSSRFAFFNIWSAFSNTGLRCGCIHAARLRMVLDEGSHSLLDSGMMDFQNCFLLIFIFVFLSESGQPVIGNCYVLTRLRSQSSAETCVRVLSITVLGR
jgi:hypothetical protein